MSRCAASTTTRRARHYLEVVIAGYGIEGMPFDLAERVMFSTASVDDPRVGAFVAYVDGRPALRDNGFTEGGCCGLQWAATLHAARGRGARQGDVHSGAQQRRHRARRHTRHWQASQMGLPLWLSLGCEVVTRYRRYLAKPPR